MAESPPQDDELKENSSPGQEEDFGDDWESAFQAEDYMFSPEKEGAEEFFLGEDDFGADEDGGAEAEADISSDGGPGARPASSEKAGVFSPFLLLAKFTSLFQAITALPLFSKISNLIPEPVVQRFRNLQTYQKALVICLPLLFCFAVVFFVSSSEEVVVIEQQVAEGEKLPSLSEEAVKEGQEPLVVSGEEVALGAADAPASEPKIIKWPFASFLIIVPPEQKDTQPSFVVVDLTLTLLGNEEDLPQEKKVFVRDIIYQFFKNRPFSELHRFSLARGDMKRQLMAWMKKQWPEAPVVSILIDRYKVI